ncbi:hypothetical protein DN412_14130 [Cupriavidus lacunae]|uniref:Uncharacterized protein n=2 Tax=Cupriavidus TaxID=106589 RepID=A0A370NVX9_9BURK|nr:hypothetical protein DN412_14130 [Cupriavidus lacunae]
MSPSPFATGDAPDCLERACRRRTAPRGAVDTPAAHGTDVAGIGQRWAYRRRIRASGGLSKPGCRGTRRAVMNIVWLVGAVVIILAVLSFFGLR